MPRNSSMENIECVLLALLLCDYLKTAVFLFIFIRAGFWALEKCFFKCEKKYQVCSSTHILKIDRFHESQWIFCLYLWLELTHQVLCSRRQAIGWKLSPVNRVMSVMTDRNRDGSNSGEGNDFQP